MSQPVAKPINKVAVMIARSQGAAVKAKGKVTAKSMKPDTDDGIVVKSKVNPFVKK